MFVFLFCVRRDSQWTSRVVSRCRGGGATIAVAAAPRRAARRHAACAQALATKGLCIARSGGRAGATWRAARLRLRPRLRLSSRARALRRTQNETHDAIASSARRRALGPNRRIGVRQAAQVLPDVRRGLKPKFECTLPASLPRDADARPESALKVKRTQFCTPIDWRTRQGLLIKETVV